MNAVLSLGLVLTLGGIAGYLVGLSTPYVARAFSLTLLMVGIALVAMWRAFEPAEVEP